MKNAFVILSLLLLSSVSHADTYVGRIIPPFPDEIENLGGALINFETGKEVKWSQTLVKLDGTLYLWLNSFEIRAGKKAYFKVIHHIELPMPNVGEGIYFAQCMNKETNENNITAFGNGAPEQEWHDAITHAWKPNLEIGEFETVNPNNIICYNEGYGI
jgi:hypothetical protein